MSNFDSTPGSAPGEISEVSPQGVPRREVDVARFATLTLGTLVLDRGLALAFAVLMSGAFGTGKELDSYLLSVAGPALLTVLLGDLIYSLLLPEFMTAATPPPRAAGRWGVVAWSVIALVLLTAAYGAAWSAMIGVADRGGDGTKLLILGLIATPAILLTGIASLGGTVLIAAGNYAAAAFRIPLTSFVTLVTLVVWLHFRTEVVGLAVSFMAGSLASALLMSIMLIAMLGRPELKLQAAEGQRLLRRLGGSTLPLLIAGIVSQASTPIERLIGFGLGPGVVSSLNFGRVLGSPPLLIGQSIATASYPRFVDLNLRDAADRDQALRHSIAMVVFLMLPMSIALALLADPLVQVVYHRGAFDEQSVARTSVCAAILAAALVPIAVSAVVMRYLYAARAFTRVAAVSALTLGAYCASALSLGWLFGFAGLAVASALASVMQAVGLLIAGGQGRPRRWSYFPFASVARSAAAGLLMAFSMFLVDSLIHLASGIMGRIEIATLAALVGGVTYCALAFLLRSPELMESLGIGRRLIGADGRHR